jgi:AcrR family transcriptional regulator
VTKHAAQVPYHDAVIHRPAQAGDARRRRLSAQERKASIVAAAMSVFAEVGYQRGTMAEVARRVGVSEPVIFQNFGSKAAVFVAVLDEATARITAGMRERAAAAGSVAGWLDELLASDHLARMEGHHPHDVLFADAMRHREEPRIRNAFRRTHRAVAQAVAELLRSGQAEGTVRSDLDPEVGAWWLLSFLASSGMRAATMPDRARVEGELAAMAIRALMIGDEA